MITVRLDKQFLKEVGRLPVSTQRRLESKIILLRENPYDPRLHTKRLSGAMTDILSFRITRDWRVLFKFLDAYTIKLLLVSHRKDAYR